MADNRPEEYPMDVSLQFNQSLDIFASDDPSESTLKVNERNCAQEEVYRYVLGEFSSHKNYCGKMPHWFIPTHTLHAPACMPNIHDCNPPLNIPFPFRLYRPLPFLPPANVNVREYLTGDPLLLLPEEKEAWERELKSLVHDARKVKKWAVKQDPPLNVGKVKKRDQHKPLYSVYSYINVAKHLKKDPCPQFSGEENWLATGGCVTHCQLGSFRTVLLLPTGKEMDTLRVISLEESAMGWSCEKAVKPVDIRLLHNQRIYQVVAAGCLKKGFVLVRQTTGCSVVHIKFIPSNQSLSVKSILEIKDDDGLFTSIDFQSYSDHQFCTLDGDHFLKIWDTSTSTCISTDHITSKNEQSDNWGCIKFSNNPNEVIYADRQTVFIKDLRVPLNESAVKYSPSKIVDDCEQLSLLFSSSQSSIMYAATSHNLLSLDLRSGWQQRWTHMLQSSPFYGCVQKSGQQEVVMLGSCGLDDSVAIVNTYDNSKPQSCTLPATLPSLGDSLLWARVQGECLSPVLGERMEMSAAGITILPCTKNGAFFCVKVTSIGDVFYHQLTNEPLSGSIIQAYSSKEQNGKDLACWKEWEEAQEQISSKRRPVLPQTVQAETDLFEAIKQPLEMNKERQKKVLSWHKTFPRRTMKEDKPFEILDWNEALCDLSRYRDLMTGVLLEAWDSDCLVRVPDSNEYVEQWLGKLSTTRIGKLDEMNMSTASLALNQSHVHADVVDLNASQGEPRSQTLDDSGFKAPKRETRQSSKRIKTEPMGFC